MEKYILSISYVDARKELFTDAHGLFSTYEEAEEYAGDEIENIIDEHIKYYDDEDYVRDNFEFDYAIKKIII